MSSDTPTDSSSGSRTDDNGCGIPVIDLSPDRDETKIASELLDAFSTIGFCTLIHHGVPSEIFRKAFLASKSFFELPLATKLRYKYKSPAANRGYIPYGSEKHDKDGEGRFLPADRGETETIAITPDQKETMDIGYDDPSAIPSEKDGVYANEWPTELSPDVFRGALETYFEEMDNLNLRLMHYIGEALGLPDGGRGLVEQCNAKPQNLRLLHYPSTVRDQGTGGDTVLRGNAHTDFGTLTLLAQDSVGGLKVRRADGTWTSVRPVEDSIVVNVGDMLMRWSNDRLKATLHKVESPDAATATAEVSPCAIVPERYSIAFFCNANKDVEIKNLFPDEPAKYEPINAHEYLTQRLAATIST
ncbi:unnamed protein product [Pseudo-nitzschia multistriata]|uniref:Fe2OG dioxygenase domain-containing protein n=1 Tax=Pseudo-nitzschia multistriata TaxID=183589 RepID=A0A448YZ23_9STRA|nr:unnamed protein product [Pseudo-nitzschia multistriata]VEU35097.1 unnamed protein product [Pseudo-nitzschia multistriata]